MWHCRMTIIIAAALAMAACDTPVEEPGDQPDTSITYDVMSETGKGDDPYPTTDTTLPDSGGEMDTGADSSADDTMITEIITHETIDTSDPICDPPFPEGAEVECSGYDCTLTWFDNCWAQCIRPNGTPWGPNGTPEEVVRLTCKLRQP